MTIYHFCKSVEIVNSSAKLCPTWKLALGERPFTKAFSLIQLNFSEFAAMRHAVAHSADKSLTPKKHADNAFSGSFASAGIVATDVENLVITDSLIGCEFISTFDGNVLSYDISRQTLACLNNVKQEVFQAFELASLWQD